MNNDYKLTDISHLACWGMGRGFVMQTITQPLEVIKTIQQTSRESRTAYKIGRELYQNEGVKSFYKGFPLQLVRVVARQSFYWPMIIKMPAWLNQHKVDVLGQQVLTGLSIATVDSLVITPLDRKIISAMAGTHKGESLKDSIKKGWSGFSTNWGRSSVGWSVFLAMQHYLKNYYREKTGKEKLGLPQLICIALPTGFVTSLCVAPFDYRNTVKQAGTSSYNLSIRNIKILYRGWPLAFVGLVIHNIASIYLIDRLGKKTTIRSLEE